MKMTEAQLRGKIVNKIYESGILTLVKDPNRLKHIEDYRVDETDYESINLHIETDIWGESITLNVGHKFAVDLGWSCTSRNVSMAVSAIALYSRVTTLAAQIQALIDTTDLT